MKRCAGRLIVVAAIVGSFALPVEADPLNCGLSGYRGAPGLSATVADNTLTVAWDGDTGQEVRLRFAIDSGTPTIRELAVRLKSGQWSTLGTNLTPEYRLVAGFRRITNQQLTPLRALGVEITPAVIDQYKWDAFWDAPLYIDPAAAAPAAGRGAPASGRGTPAGGGGAPPGGRGAPADGRGAPAGGRGAPAGGRGAPAAGGRGDAADRGADQAAAAPSAEPAAGRGAAAGGGGNPPPAGGVAGQPGRPRNPAEIRRASAVYRAASCDVKTNGSHLEVSFPGVELGMFAGRLQYTIYKGTNLIRQEIVARTSESSVAYKYDSGLKGFSIGSSSRMVWRDLSHTWQDYSFGGTKNDIPVALETSNRTLVAESRGGSLAAFPPPHSFFWAREISINLGYSWYRKDSETFFAFGIRQPEQEHASENPENFALYSARPGTDQRMPMYLYPSPAAGQATLQSVLALTRQDRYKPLPGYQVMALHFHTSMPGRLAALGSLDAKLPDLLAWKGAGINIVGPVDGGRLQGDRLTGLANYFEAARRHSDTNFLIMPNEESSAGNLGGHNDVLLSKPVFWDYQRPAGTPFVEPHPTYGKVYHVGSPADMMELARIENMLVFMPHPRSKGSTGWPDAMKDTPQFLHDNYRGIGARWGMGLDLSETRLCEYRCQTLLDDMNNWIADTPLQLKFLQAITETYENGPTDDIYANNPVNYLKLATLPKVDDMSSVIDVMKRGDYFWTSGEVLIPSYSVQGTGNQRTIVADVEWTFPLAFVEVVWGDGIKTERQVISTTDLPPFGSKRFEIPFNAAGKKWVRFAAWDTATNGALVMPIRVSAAGR